MAVYVWAYRLAMLVAGAGVIASADVIGWRGALLIPAGLMALGVLVTWFAPEPVVVARTVAGGFAVRFATAVVDPLREFIGRSGAFLILGYVMLFKLGEAMAGVMLAPFYRALGFDRAAVAVASGPFTLAATIVGIGLGGWLIARVGLARALLWTGFIQMLAMALYVALAYSAGNKPLLYTTVIAEAFAEGLADAAFITYLSGLCAAAYTATQFALLTSLAAVALRTIGGVSGFVAQALGWKLFYALTTFASLPAMLLMLVILRRHPPEQRSDPG